MNNKGQAAMEFLMTYGWAILAAIIAIGVLSYFGIFSPGNFITEGDIEDKKESYRILCEHNNLSFFETNLLSIYCVKQSGDIILEMYDIKRGAEDSLYLQLKE